MDTGPHHARSPNYYRKNSSWMPTGICSPPVKSLFFIETLFATWKSPFKNTRREQKSECNVPLVYTDTQAFGELHFE